MNKKEYLEIIDQVIEEGPYNDEWESLCQHEVPTWYLNDKFGIFIHWGLYSVPAYGSEWYARNVYRYKSKEYKYHVEKYGPLDQFGYKDFIPLFKAEKFNPKEWAELFQESGAKFVMPVAEHHDGFQMYGSDLSKWNSVEMGPCRDIVGELKGAVEEKGMRICTSSHRAENWWFFNHGRNIPSDVQNPEYASFYGPAQGPTLSQENLYDNPPDQEFLEDWLVRTCEIVDKYHPSIMYFDWWIQVMAFKPYLKKFAAYYYNRAHEWGRSVAINAKYDAYVMGSVVRDIERGQLSSISHTFWQNDTSVAKNSWGYTEGNDYKTARSIVCDLVDIVSKNGALLLNIGPKSDGTIPEEDKKLLKEIGSWMKANGESVYGTRPWKIFGEGPTEIVEGTYCDVAREDFTEQDVRYTAKANYIYATVMKWPETGKVHLKELGVHCKHLKTDILSVEILGYDISPTVDRRTTLEVSAPIKADDMPVVIKIEIV